MSESLSNLRTSYRVFISFTSADKTLAEYLASELRRILGDYNAVYCFTLPGGRDSKAGSRPADNFVKVIDSKLQKCNVFILLWSRASKRSNWISHELVQARLLSIGNAKNMGVDFKIIPISINGCTLPFGLKSIAYIRHITNGDNQNTLNEVLKALALPTEHADPQEIVWKRAAFEIQTAFSNEEWAVVVEKCVRLAQLYPPAISTEIHYHYAIALLKTEKIAQSVNAVSEALKLEHREGDVLLLERFINHLKEKRQWNHIVTLVRLATEKFPGDARWVALQWEMANRPDNSFFFNTP